MVPGGWVLVFLEERGGGLGKNTESRRGGDPHQKNCCCDVVANLQDWRRMITRRKRAERGDSDISGTKKVTEALDSATESSAQGGSTGAFLFVFH